MLARFRCACWPVSRTISQPGASFSTRRPNDTLPPPLGRGKLTKTWDLSGQPDRAFERQGLSQVAECFLDDHGTFDASDNLGGASTSTAGLGVDVDYAPSSKADVGAFIPASMRNRLRPINSLEHRNVSIELRKISQPGAKVRSQARFRRSTLDPSTPVDCPNQTLGM